ncbi:glycosyltransferase [Cohnella luojiensis]|nr:glycosyltransferase [Cohnella luojiensis]
MNGTDPRKIAVISCVNDESKYAECLKFIHALTVPAGFTVEPLAVRRSGSMALGYNQALQQTDAKYKVYMHQDVLILNRRFFVDLIKLFEEHPAIGLLGVVGAKTLPVSGIWWEAPKRVGKIYDSISGKAAITDWGGFTGALSEVLVVDGLLMSTQYDLRWRDDLFDGWHFYDTSQCMEFIQTGYKVAVPNQQEPWCWHDCGVTPIDEAYDRARVTFCRNYLAQDFPQVSDMPLVSILIPAYNRPHFLELALQSALNQTYPHTEIIISDDSTHDGVRRMLEPYLSKHPRIRYYHNEQSSIESNYERCIELATGDYINFLNDDDLFYPEKIAKMVHWLVNRPDVSLVTSYRRCIDGQGKPLPDTESTARISESDVVINGKDLGNFCLKYCTNIIGEPTTVLFRKKDLTEKFNHYQGRRHICINDLASWLHLLTKGNAVYIAEPLSYFRRHSGQGQNDLNTMFPTLNNWFHLIQDARKNGFLQCEKDYKTALIHQLRLSSNLLQMAINADRQDLLETLSVDSVITQCIQSIVHPLQSPYRHD